MFDQSQDAMLESRTDPRRIQTRTYTFHVVATDTQPQPVTVVSANAPLGLRRYLHDLWKLRDFTMYLSMGNITARNARTTLGLMWWLVNPLLMTAVYFVAFGLILGGAKGEPTYLAHLISGIFAFRFMSQAINGSINQIVGNAKLVVNSRFPRLALPIAANVEGLFGLLVGLGAFYLIVMPLNGIYPGMSLLLLPVALVLHITFTFGASALVARFAVPYRDVQNLVPHLMRIWLYLSPVLWTYDRITNLLGDGKTWASLMELNPMFSFLSLYRSALLGQPIDRVHLGVATAWAIITLLLGVVSFIRNDRHLARHL